MYPASAWSVTGWSSLFAVPQIMCSPSNMDKPRPFRQRLALAYTMVIGGIVAFGLWFWLIPRCSMNRVAPPFALLLPVFAMASGVLFLGERLTPTLIVGGLLALAG